jgi:hypothetical protein
MGSGMPLPIGDRQERIMAGDHLNSTRAGRSIENLDRPKNTAIDPGQGDAHGRKMPRYKDDAVIKEAKDALDHVQVSGIGDMTEDGREVQTAKNRKQ